MSDVKQQVLSVNYDYANGVVEFIGTSGAVCMSIGMSTIISISNDIKPVYSIEGSGVDRRVNVYYVPPINTDI